MKYIIDFEDKPCCDKPNLYRMKHTNSYTICVPREILEIFPRYEEQSKNDDQRLKDLENLTEGDVVIATNDRGGIRRMGLVIFVYSGEEDPFEIVSNYGVVMRRSAKDLFELGYQKANKKYTTEEFFSKSKPADDIRDETKKELSDLKPGDIIYKSVGEGKLLRRMVNYVYGRHGDYEVINETGWKFRCNLQTLIEEGWHKLKYELTTKEFYRKLREEKCDDK